MDLLGLPTALYLISLVPSKKTSDSNEVKAVSGRERDYQPFNLGSSRMIVLIPTSIESCMTLILSLQLTSQESIECKGPSHQ